MTVEDAVLDFNAKEGVINGQPRVPDQYYDAVQYRKKLQNSKKRIP